MRTIAKLKVSSRTTLNCDLLDVAPPVKSCNDPLFQNHNNISQWEFKGNGSWYDYYFKYTPYDPTDTKICAQFEATLPGSFNFNYDFNTGKARNNFFLKDGISCSNCYAYFGAGFDIMYLIIFYYKSRFALRNLQIFQCPQDYFLFSSTQTNTVRS